MAYTVDTLKYVVGMDTKQLKSKVKDADKTVKRSSASMKKALMGVAGVLGVGIGGYALIKGFKAIVGASAKQEEIFRKLRTAVELTGASYGTVKPQIDAFLSSMQRTTRYGDTDIAPVLHMITQLTGDLNKGFEGSEIAANMAAAGLFDLGTSAKYVAMAMAGEVTMLGRYIPELKTTYGLIKTNMTNTEKWAIAKDLLNKRFGGAAQKDLETYSGSLQSLGNYIGDIVESIGDKFLPVLTDMAKNFKNLIAPTEVAIARYEKMKSIFDKSTGSISAVVERFKELEGKTNKTAEEQKEYNGLINKIAEILPTVVNQYDDYGNVLSLNLSVLDDTIERKRKLLKLDKESLAIELRESIAETKKELGDQLSVLTSLEKVVENQPVAYDRYKDAIERARSRTKELRQELATLQGQLNMVTPQFGPFQEELKKTKKVVEEITMPEITMPYQGIKEFVDETKKAMDKFKTVQQNRFDWLYEHEAISAEQYVDFLNWKLAKTKEYSDEWIATQQKIEDIKEGITDKDKERWDVQIAQQEEALDVMLSGYDTFWNSLLDLDMTGAERRAAIFESIAQSFIGYTAEMLKAEIKTALLRKTVVEGTEKSKLAAIASGSAKSIAWMVKEGAVALASAAKTIYSAVAKIFSAHAGIPFVGVAIAGALVGAMIASITKFKGFAEGGLVEGLLEGKDQLLAALTKGEYVMPRRAVASIGVPAMEHMRRTGEVPTTSTSVNIDMGGFTFSGTKRADAYLIESFVEDKLIEVIEEKLRNRELVL